MRLTILMLEMYDLQIVEIVIDDKLFRKIDTPVVHPDSRKVRKFLKLETIYSYRKNFKRFS
ncbi:unnamed protein product [marine sediment metagenome]|uniref:Uncharacterized protein n=1 Tax=marine sediment metagenome TaxID=412755 RepID=X1QS38_9ZZZZ